MEIMITVMVLLIALGSLLFTFTQCLMLNEVNNNLVIAFNDAQVILEQLRGQAFEDVSVSCAAYDPNPLAIFNNLAGEAVTCTPTYLPIGAPVSNLLQVDVRIDWTERQRPRNVILSTSFATGQ